MRKIILVGLVGNHHTLYCSLINMLIKSFEFITVITLKNMEKEFNLFKNHKNIQIILENGKSANIIKKNISLINKYEVLILDEINGSYLRTLGIKFKSKKKIMLMLWQMSLEALHSLTLATLGFNHG